METIQVLFGTVARLQPLPQQILEDVFCRLLSTLTHQNMVLDLDHLLQTTGRNSVHRTSNPAGLMRSNVAERLMLFFHNLLQVLSERISYRLRHRKEDSDTNKPSQQKNKLGGMNNSKKKTRLGNSEGNMTERSEKKTN